MSAYPESMQESLNLVKKTRPKRIELAKQGLKIFNALTMKEREEVLSKYHPDYQPDSKKIIRLGPNKDERLTARIVDILESHSRINPDDIDLSNPDFDVDVLVIGGGGAGAEAAIWSMRQGAKRILLATKLRIGDANSMMSQGGMQASVNPHDSPVIHYLDVIGGGHFENKPELVKILTSEAPMLAKFLSHLGVMWDREKDGHLQTKPGGGTSRRRMLSSRDYTGAEIMRTLRDEVKSHPDIITVLEYSPTIELLRDEEGKVAGALLMQSETGEYIIVRAKSTVITTGGFGRLHIKGFPTTNHYGATADGLILAYRVGAKLRDMDTVQFHPTGAAYPEQVLGFLITEKVRGLGGQPVNKFGELFVFPLEPRDVEASTFIRECAQGRGIKTPTGRVGVWLDSPVIEEISGPGTIEKQLPAMLRQFHRFDIDIRKEPMLVYPTLHYQNGGIEINGRTETDIPNLFVAGEASGGVHGKNRLMGNSVLDYNVFGRRAGIYAAENALKNNIGKKLSLEHVKKWEKELKDAGIETKKISPILFPDYRNFELIKKHRKELDPFLGFALTGWQE